jgi:two-component system chemotaxis response regulator CheY
MTSCLIVDDSKVVRALVRRIIAPFGFEIAEAADGLLALDACRAAMPDLILLDWNMPNMDGIAFLSALRRMPGGQAPKVVFCTTESEIPRIETALATGADEYIMKPFDAETMEAKLAMVGIL